MASTPDTPLAVPVPPATEEGDRLARELLGPEEAANGRAVTPLVAKATSRKLIAFGWYGGKFSHLGWLLPLLPDEGVVTFVEPFGGSAAVMLNRRPAPVEVYNDLDREVVNFFRVLREHQDELLAAIALTPFSRDEFALALTPIRDEDNVSAVERARRFYVRARQARTGLAQTATLGRWANCRGNSRRGMAAAVSRWLGGVDGLADVAERLARIQIENRPALDLIRTYDSAATLFYVDPPYLHATRGDSNNYGFEMSTDQHRALAAVLNAVEGRVVLSGYNHELMDELYPAGTWRRIDADPKLCHASKSSRTEAVWLNFTGPTADGDTPALGSTSACA